MCLYYEPSYDTIVDASVNNALQQTFKKHGDMVSCNGTYVFHALLESGETATISCIPITGAVRFVMFPMAPTHTATLVPCENAPCLTAHLEGLMRPHEMVPFVEPVNAYALEHDYHYRSLSEFAQDQPDIPPCRVMRNPDGGVVIVLPVAAFIKRDLSFDERSHLVLKLQTCLCECLDHHGIPLSRLLGDDDSDDDVLTSRTFGLIHYLMTASAPECDIVVGLMPEGGTSGTFTMCNMNDSGACVLPFPGQCHGDQASMGQVQEDVYLLTNDPTHKYVLRKPDGEKDAIDVHVLPLGLEAYANATQGKVYSHLWMDAQLQFQQSIKEDLYVLIDESLKKNDLPPLEKSTQLRATNLKGFHIPKHTTQMSVDIDWVRYNDPQMQRLRIAMMERRRAKDRKRHAERADH